MLTGRFRSISNCQTHFVNNTYNKSNYDIHVFCFGKKYAIFPIMLPLCFQA